MIDGVGRRGAGLAEPAGGEVDMLVGDVKLGDRTPDSSFLYLYIR